MSLPQKKFIIFSYKTCLHPGKLSAQFPCEACMPCSLEGCATHYTYPQSSPLPSLWQQGTGAWLFCSRDCSFHSPSQEGTLVSLLLIHSPGGEIWQRADKVSFSCNILTALSADCRGLPLSCTLYRLPGVFENLQYSNNT